MVNSLDYFNKLYDGCIKILKEFSEEGRKVRYLVKRDGCLIVEDFYGTGGLTIQGCSFIDLDPVKFFGNLLSAILDDEGFPIEKVERVIFSREFLKFNANQLRRYVGYSCLSIYPELGGSEFCLSVPEHLLNGSVKYPSIFDMVENKDVPGRKWEDVILENEDKEMFKELLSECLSKTQSTSLNIFKVLVGFTDYMFMYDVDGGGEYNLYIDKEILGYISERYCDYDEVFLFRLSRVSMGSERIDKNSRVFLVY